MVSIFDIRSVFADVWGYAPSEMNTDLNVTIQPEKSDSNINYFRHELLGKSFFMPVTLGTYELFNPVMRITSKKTIIETPMVNRLGTVKELIGTEEFRINIKGIIVRDDNRFPEDEIKKLQDLYMADKPHEIKSVLTECVIRDYNTVIITDITWPEMSGIQNVKPYEINLVTDSVFDLNPI